MSQVHDRILIAQPEKQLESFRKRFPLISVNVKADGRSMSYSLKAHKAEWFLQYAQDLISFNNLPLIASLKKLTPLSAILKIECRG